MAAPVLSTPFQPYVYESPQSVVTPFQILGGEAQVLQIMLRPEEKIIAKTGSMCYVSESLQTETFAPADNLGNLLWQWFFGKTDAVSTMVNTGLQDGYIGLGATSFARILPVDLNVFGGEIICQAQSMMVAKPVLIVHSYRRDSSGLATGPDVFTKIKFTIRTIPQLFIYLILVTNAERDSFLCSINDVSVTAVVTRRLRPGLFGSEGFFMQKLVGRGLAFITAGGSLIQKNLARGEIIVVDAGCLVAMTSSVELDVKYAPFKRALFGGESPLRAHLTGPGVVFIQSLPLYRLAQKIARVVTSPNVRDNPRLFFQIAIFCFLAYVMVVSSLILAEQ